MEMDVEKNKTRLFLIFSLIIYFIF